MGLTKANLAQMLTAIQNLDDALPQVNSVDRQASEALANVQASWRSPSAAPAFYQHMQAWQEDQQTLTSALNQLLTALSDAHNDLLTKEQSLTI